MAAASPSAVASSASAIPGATTARLVVCDFEMPMKLFMMPQTVPNRPTNGAVAPIVASTPVPRAIRRALAASIRSRRDAIRSLRPSFDIVPADACNSATAASRNFPTTLFVSLIRSTLAVVDLALASAPKALRRRPFTPISSMVLASHAVQVMTEAMTSPINTACTTMSALTNMPHGVRSRGSAAVSMTGRPASSCAVAVVAARQANSARLADLRSIFDIGENPDADARHQHLVLGVGDVVADVLVEQVFADDADGPFA